MNPAAVMGLAGDDHRHAVQRHLHADRVDQTKVGNLDQVIGIDFVRRANQMDIFRQRGRDALTTSDIVRPWVSTSPG